MTEFLISVYISATASVDVTTETNSLTDSADRKYAIPGGAKINMPYQINNDERGVRYRTIARHPISKTWETKIGDVTINTTKHTRVATGSMQ